MPKILLIIFLSLIFSACQNLQFARPELVKQDSPLPQVAKEEVSTPAPSLEKSKIGIILGPGGLRSFAHIGFLQEINKARISLEAIFGFEMGALVGGIYANKGQAYDVEWQMMKMSEDNFIEKSLIGQQIKSQEVSRLRDFLRMNLSNQKIEDSSIPFSCPTLDADSREVIFNTRGDLAGVLPQCVSMFPMFKPDGNISAALVSLSLAVKKMRSKGINYIIFVNLIDLNSGPFTSKDITPTETIWNIVAQSLSNQTQGINRIVNINLSGTYVHDFAKRRESVAKGRESGKIAVQQILQELSL